MSRVETIWGLVLAGGKSRRMGSDKALLRVDGATQLSRTVALLERHLPQVYVSARSEQRDEQERARYPQIVDRFANLGPVAGILSAMHEHPSVSWLVVACDLPNVDDTTIAHLVDERDGKKPFTAFLSTYDELPEPLCAIYGAEAAPIVAAFVEEGIKCPRKMLIRSDTQLLKQPNPRALDNVNTPDDLAQSALEIV